MAVARLEYSALRDPVELVRLVFFRVFPSLLLPCRFLSVVSFGFNCDLPLVRESDPSSKGRSLISRSQRRTKVIARGPFEEARTSSAGEGLYVIEQSARTSRECPPFLELGAGYFLSVWNASVLLRRKITAANTGHVDFDVLRLSA